MPCPLDRFNAFSDGVFAIAITLLVLELTVPLGPDLFERLVEEWPEFLGYLISFAFIGGSWMTHAHTTRLMKRGDTLAGGLNLVALLFIALLPFSTSLMVSNLPGPDAQLGVLIYGINVLVASVMLTLLMAYLVRERTLLIDEVADETLAPMTRQRRILQRGLARRGGVCPGGPARGRRSLRGRHRADAGGPVPPPGPSPCSRRRRSWPLGVVPGVGGTSTGGAR